MARGQLDLGYEDESRPSGVVDDALAAFGLYAEDEQVFDEDEFWLWPENEEAFAIWLRLQTQWNVLPELGRTGLNYPAVEVCMRMLGVGQKARNRLFGLIQIMEQACLDEWAQRR